MGTAAGAAPPLTAIRDLAETCESSDEETADRLRTVISQRVPEWRDRLAGLLSDVDSEVISLLMADIAELPAIPNSAPIISGMIVLLDGIQNSALAAAGPRTASDREEVLSVLHRISDTAKAMSPIAETAAAAVTLDEFEQAMDEMSDLGSEMAALIDSVHVPCPRKEGLSIGIGNSSSWWPLDRSAAKGAASCDETLTAARDLADYVDIARWPQNENYMSMRSRLKDRWDRYMSKILDLSDSADRVMPLGAPR